MEKGQTALLIIDMINRFDFEGGARLGRAAVHAAPRIAQLRERFEEAQAPVIYVNDNFAQWQGEFHDLVRACEAEGGHAAEIVERLSPRQGDYYILKPKHSAFLATALDVLLAKLKVRQLVLTGLSADSCILATAQDANMREFKLWIPSGCVGSRTEVLKKQALALIKGARLAETGSTRIIRGVFPAAS